MDFVCGLKARKHRKPSVPVDKVSDSTSTDLFENKEFFKPKYILFSKLVNEKLVIIMQQILARTFDHKTVGVRLLFASESFNYFPMLHMLLRGLF